MQQTTEISPNAPPCGVIYKEIVSDIEQRLFFMNIIRYACFVIGLALFCLVLFDFFDPIKEFDVALNRITQVGGLISSLLLPTIGISMDKILNLQTEKIDRMKLKARLNDYYSFDQKSENEKSDIRKNCSDFINSETR